MASQSPQDRAPYSGPAPEPSRRIALNSEQDTGGDVVGYGSNETTHVADPATLTPGIDREFNHGTQMSPPPADPNSAASIAEANSRQGELIQALGQQRADFERQMQEMQFNFQMQMAAMQASQSQSTPSLPANIDPDTPLTVGQVAQIFQNFGQQTKADIIRQSISLDPTEEAQVMANNPYLNGVPEPRRSELLKQIVLRHRASTYAADNSPQTPAPSASRATSSAQRPAPVTRPAQRVTPHVEATRGGASVDDTPPANLNQQLQAEYLAASQIKDRKERLAAQKAVYNKSLAANGVANETQVGWKMG